MTSILENAVVKVEFDRDIGGLTAITNKLTGEMYIVTGDTFAIATTAFHRTQAEMSQVDWTATTQRVTGRYADADLEVELTYGLQPGDHFLQKRLTVTFAAAGGVKQIVVSQPSFTAAGLELACYRHPDFDWVTEYVEAKHGWGLRRPPGSEPARTFLGRTAKGGFFTGMEMAYDNSSLTNGTVMLGYAPNLKAIAG